jgi:hypothetical protein
MTRAVPMVGASAPLVSVNVPLMALAPYQGGSPAPSVRWRVDGGYDEPVDVVAPLLRC